METFEVRNEYTVPGTDPRTGKIAMAWANGTRWVGIASCISEASVELRDALELSVHYGQGPQGTLMCVPILAPPVPLQYPVDVAFPCTTTIVWEDDMTPQDAALLRVFYDNGLKEAIARRSGLTLPTGNAVLRDVNKRS